MDHGQCAAVLPCHTPVRGHAHRSRPLIGLGDRDAESRIVLSQPILPIRRPPPDRPRNLQGADQAGHGLGGVLSNVCNSFSVAGNGPVAAPVAYWLNVAEGVVRTGPLYSYPGRRGLSPAHTLAVTLAFYSTPCVHFAMHAPAPCTPVRAAAGGSRSCRPSRARGRRRRSAAPAGTPGCRPPHRRRRSLRPQSAPPPTPAGRPTITAIPDSPQDGVCLVLQAGGE